MDLITIPMTLHAQRYQQEVLDAAVIHHFDNHPLATRPIIMDDNTRPHRGRAVIAHLRNNAIETLPWQARNYDLNPIEHLRSSSPSSGSSTEKSARIGIGTPRGMAENPHGAHQTPGCKYEEEARICHMCSGEDTPDTDASVSDGLVKHIYSLFKTFKLPT